MSKFTPIKVKFVAWHFCDCIPALNVMSTIERGIYYSLCVYLYEAGGRLTNKTEVLAKICGLPEQEFVTYWDKLKSKFVHGSDYITHKRCMTELKKTDKIIQSGKKGGIISAEMRKKQGINHSQEIAGQGNPPSTTRQD
jgi:uncharacterized protein YdaU (DUF1376 family)